MAAANRVARPAAGRLLRFVQPSSARPVEPVRRDSSFAEKQESYPALLLVVLCEHLVAGSEMTAFVGEAVAPPEDGAGLIVLDERGCRRSVEEGLA